MIELPSTLKPILELYSPDKACLGRLVRDTEPYQAFRDSATCLSRATYSRLVLNWLSERAQRVDKILNQNNRHRDPTERLNGVDRQLVSSLGGEFGSASAVKTVQNSYPETGCGGRGMRNTPLTKVYKIITFTTTATIVHNLQARSFSVDHEQNWQPSSVDPQCVLSNKDKMDI